MCCQRQALESSGHRGALVLGVHTRASHTFALLFSSPPRFPCSLPGV